jgi:hypothetical protein
MNSTVKAIALGTATTVAGLFSLTTAASAFTFSGPAPTINSDTTGFYEQFAEFFQEERVKLEDANLYEFDPDSLFLKYDHEVKVHFINEGAKYRNQLSYEATGTTNREGVVFKDISSAEAVGNWGGDALDLGDWVSLGTIGAGSQLDFALRADGYCLDNPEDTNCHQTVTRRNGETVDFTNHVWDRDDVFSTRTAENSDGLQHVVSYVLDNRYILMGWEDIIRGGDMDYNDVFFVVDIGEGNARHIADVPEPASTLGLMALGVTGLLSLRRRSS